jgi:hypothetical protein
MLQSIALLLAVASATPAPASAAWNTTSWLGVKLGEPLASVAARMGDPIAVSKDPALTKFVYLTEDTNAFLTVLSERGIVSGIRLWSVTTAPGKTTDPFGIALNDTKDKVLAKRGKPVREAADIDGPFESYQDRDVLWLYHIKADQSVTSITLSTTEAAISDLPAQPLPKVHSGESAADAVRVVQPNAGDTSRWEQMYLAIRPCGQSGTWLVRKTEHQGVLDVVSASCNLSGLSQAFYFAPSNAH